MEENIEETLTFYRLPREHHKHLKSTNMLERIKQELKRRTHVLRIFPDEQSALRLIRALAVEIHEDWSKPTATSTWKCCANNASSSNFWRPPKVNATAYSSASADSDLASAPELCPCGAPAAATSPYGAFVNKPSLFPALT